MARPCKIRYIDINPTSSLFQPIDSKNSKERIILTIDEFEAIRLADYNGFEQSEAAVAMNISRQTFGRILDRARKKVADALVNGKTLEIGGGIIMHTRRKRMRCRHCHNEWHVPQKKAHLFQCPHCEN